MEFKLIVTIVSYILALAVGAMVAIFAVYKYADTDKLLMRKPPLGVVNDGLQWLFIRLRSKKWVYNYWEFGGQIFWYDWHRGMGYGYLEPDLQPKPGDEVQVKIRSNNPKLRGRVFRLYFYKIFNPDESIPNFFLFRTIYGGVGPERKPEKDEEIGARFRTFQRLV